MPQTRHFPARRSPVFRLVSSKTSQTIFLPFPLYCALRAQQGKARITVFKELDSTARGSSSRRHLIAYIMLRAVPSHTIPYHTRTILYHTVTIPYHTNSRQAVCRVQRKYTTRSSYTNTRPTVGPHVTAVLYPPPQKQTPISESGRKKKKKCGRRQKQTNRFYFFFLPKNTLCKKKRIYFVLARKDLVARNGERNDRTLITIPPTHTRTKKIRHGLIWNMLLLLPF